MTAVTAFAALYRHRNQLPLRTARGCRRKVEPCARTSALTNFHPGISTVC